MGEPSQTWSLAGEPARSGHRRAAVRAALVLISACVSLAVSELSLRAAAQDNSHFRVWPASMHHTFRPDPVVMPGHAPEARFSSNSHGLRGPETGPDGEARVLAIGGSTTECLYIDEASAWPLRAGKLLSAEGRPVWSASAGLSGMNSGDHVVHARFLVPELPRIDVVVALVGVNDLGVALGSPETYRPVPADLAPETSETLLRRAFQQIPGKLEKNWEPAGPFFRRSALYQLVRRIRAGRSRDLAAHHLVNDDSGRAMARWRANRQKASEMIDELPDLSAHLATYRRNLGSFVDLLAARGVRVILMTQPTLWRADLGEAEQKVLWMGGKGDFMRAEGLPYYTPRALAEGMRAFNGATLGVCEERGVECVDLAEMIPKDTDHFYDDCHFGTATSETIAAIVAAAVKKGRPFVP